MARIYKHPAGRAEYKAGMQSRIELPRNFHMQKLICRLSVTHDNAAAVVPNDLGLANLINSIQIVGDGNENIKQYDAKKCIMNSVYHAQDAMDSYFDLTIGNGKTGYIYFSIDFAKRDMVRPADTIENTTNFKSFDMLINWGTDANVGADFAVVSAELGLLSCEWTEYTRNPNERTAHFIETKLGETITATTTNHTIELPTGKHYYGFMLNALVDGVASDSVINKITLKSGTTTFVEISADDLRAHNMDEYGISWRDGWLYLDFAERGRISDLLNTKGKFNTLELVLDVTKQAGTNTINVYPEVFDVIDHIENPA